MAETTQIMIGANVSCIDGGCGVVSRVVIDPVAGTITHVVVAPHHGHGIGRLVPLDLVQSTATAVRLGCDLATFEGLQGAEETQFLRGPTGFAGYGPEETLSWPYYGLGAGGMRSGRMSAGLTDVSQAVTYETVPLGEVAIRRGEQVRATDGAVGHIQGLVVDADGQRVTHVLLQKGHAWGHRTLAIPIGAVQAIDDSVQRRVADGPLAYLLPPGQVSADEGVRLNITKQQVRDLPSVDVAIVNK